MRSAAVSVAGFALYGQTAAQSSSVRAGTADDLERLSRMDSLERYVAIDNKCAWPNLTLMPDGAIVATIFGQPCHGTCEGSTECWISRDGGRTWTFLSVPAPNKSGTFRANVAAGLTSGGALVVLCGGGKVPDPPTGDQQCCLMPLVSRSMDGGRSWVHQRGDYDASRSERARPLRRYHPAQGKASCRLGDWEQENTSTAWVFFSDDDGRTWSNARPIAAEDYNETTLLTLGDGKLLAASRTLKNEHTEIFASEDGGQTWKPRGPRRCPRRFRPTC